jgi:hypothetical protein
MVVLAAYVRVLRPAWSWVVAIADTLRVAALISIPALISER